MSHLDEGTLHALLDGELEMTEVKEIQAHLGSCTACGTRLRQVKEFYAEADRLVGALEVPGSAPAPGMSRSVGGEAPTRAERATAPAVRPPPPIEGQPIFLIPDNPDWAERARRFMAPMKWAAVLLVAVAAGFIASEVKRGPRATAADSDLEPAIAESTTAPVLSAEEATMRPDSGALAGATAAAPPPAAMAKTRPAPAPAPSAAAPAPARQRVVTASKNTPTAVVDSAMEAKAQAVELADRTARQNDRQTTAGRAAAPTPAAEPPAENVRSEAARALEELDRERRAARAAAATAALDSARRDSIRRSESPRQQPRTAVAAAPAPAPATPPQRTLEQRADTYMRIGLDEAARQLGRPVHVIEGLSPLFMGLAQGRTSPGADASRPVVRVVYQDAQGRLILLDQQHLRPGQDTTAPGPGEPHWTMGEILLHLHGEIGPEVLRNMRARVR